MRSGFGSEKGLVGFFSVVSEGGQRVNNAGRGGSKYSHVEMMHYIDSSELHNLRITTSGYH